MADRALRGSNLGARSMESDENVIPSERQLTTYVCAQGHRTELPFSIEADVPPTWECRCGLDGERELGAVPLRAHVRRELSLTGDDVLVGLHAPGTEVGTA